jgi:integrase
MGVDAQRVATARRLLAELGVSVPDLLDRQDVGPAGLPTWEQYLPRVIAAAGPGATRTYGTYWARMATAWGHRTLLEVAASDIEALQYRAAASARSRRNQRSGRHAGEHVIAAARAVYNLAIADGLLPASASPAHRVAKPRRLPNTRRALSPGELVEINVAARVSGNDTVLDALLLRLHTETACRRGGALALRLGDLDAHRCLIQLREKGNTVRWQPISPALAASLTDHATARGALLPTDQVLRYRDGRALTSRRYDHLWHRLGRGWPPKASPPTGSGTPR